MTSNRVSTLLQWCDSQRIRIDPRLRILEDKNGLGVYAADSYIENPATLVYIPKSAVLSVRSCSLSAHIDPVLYGTGATLALALAVHGELLIGAASHWFAYLQSLPHTRVDIAVFWGADAEHEQGLENNAGDEEVEDGREAKAWIKGTQVERELGFGSVLVRLPINFGDNSLPIEARFFFGKTDGEHAYRMKSADITRQLSSR
ncbi:hypothetical protein BD410DRAFT_144197 [Rickenella mellea]|uniref:SET domain-containing protein n=1 Tax=Rickenella mellea TaxID=50990 RepID=A0A4Y7Q8J3_9AGAM|nr:hypothetical protein BD410DRAFT_144197 [Rickenella mellea]